MDPVSPITTAIIAALSVEVADTAKKAISDADEGLIGLIKRKWGAECDVVQAIGKLEQKPEATACRQVIQEEIAAAELEKDVEVLQAAEALLTQIKTAPGGTQHMQMAVGNHIAQTDGDGTESVNIHHHEAQTFRKKAHPIINLQAEAISASRPWCNGHRQCQWLYQTS